MKKSFELYNKCEQVIISPEYGLCKNAYMITMRV
jgi:hypothetical protein